MEVLFVIIGTFITLLVSMLAIICWQRVVTQKQTIEQLGQTLEEKQAALISTLQRELSLQADRSHAAMAQQSTLMQDAVTRSGDRLRDTMMEAFDRLRASVGKELKETRESMAQGMEQVALHLRQTAQQLTQVVGELTQTADMRLAEISNKVSERLDEGFKKTNDTFVSVMARLATIDEAQKKIDGLTTNVVSLQELLGDKRSRGALGEVQLAHLIRNMLPPQVYEFQAVLSNGTRADCILHLPEPTGTIAIDAKFPLENYYRLFEADADRIHAKRAFKLDIRKHIDDIASKYIVPHETADGAVMFIPAEAVFAEIHADHPDLIQYALSHRVWMVSPTTLMAVLNTARAVIKDVETRKQVHIIQETLGRLRQEFDRFDERMKKLATHIRQAHDDVQQVAVTSEKISRRFNEIEQVRLEKDGGAETSE